MEIKEKYCVSLEIAKQLKEARWEKPTWFHYDYEDKSSLRIQDKPSYSIDGFHAPLATEILEELPIVISVNSYQAIKEKAYEVMQDNFGFNDASLPNALAKMW